MVPYIFVSSTIRDLHHLRDVVRDTIDELGHMPVMSEHGDVRYMAAISAEDACYQTVKDCQLAILIVGKRYGELSENGLSVTHNEFLKAQESRVPMISLVDKDVLAYKGVYDVRPPDEPPGKFPDMDDPGKTFALIAAISDSPANNSILPYTSVADVRLLLKKQLAHLFGDLLRNRYDPVKTQITDVLSEIKTLRHELGSGKGHVDQSFLLAMRFIIDEENRQYRDFLEETCGPVDAVIPMLLDSDTFDDFVKKAGIELDVLEAAAYPEGVRELRHSQKLSSLRSWAYQGRRGTGSAQAGFYRHNKKKVVINKVAHECYSTSHASLRKLVPLASG